MPDGRVFTESDYQKIKEMYRLYKQTIGNPRSRSLNPAAPEFWPAGVYVVQVPEGGIPPMGNAGSGSGMEGVSCTIYKRVHGQLQSGGFRETVYNLGTNLIQPGWALAVKDKFGTYYIAFGDAEGSQVPSLNEPGGGACYLARLKETDWIKATGPENIAYLQPNGSGGWSSVDADTGTANEGIWYFGKFGALIAQWNSDTGLLDLFLDGLRMMNCGDGCYTAGPLTGHFRYSGTGSDLTGDCEGEILTICLECTCKPINLWHGAGWYCVNTGTGTGTGTGTDAAQCEPIYLTEARRCDYDVEICTGPYDTYAQAVAVCGSASPVSTPCCPNSIPFVLNASLETLMGPVCDAAAIAIYDGAGRWTADLSTPGGNLHVELYCHEVSPGVFLWRVDRSGCEVGTLTLSGSCSPFDFVSTPGLSGCCSGSTVRIRFVE